MSEYNLTLFYISKKCWDGAKGGGGSERKKPEDEGKVREYLHRKCFALSSISNLLLPDSI